MAYQKLKEALEKMVEEEQKREYIIFPDGKKMKKTLKQCKPYTEKEWEKVKEKQKAYKNKQLINFIVKVFFEDGALQFKETREKSIKIE